MSHIHSIYDTDPHFIIDPVTRRITNMSGKTTIVQGDHKSERFTFEIPRFVDGHDMSLCDVVEIHYDNIASSGKETYSDVEEIDDLQVSPASNDVVIFSWLITGNATQYKGALNFSIGFQCTDSEGNIDYELGTLIHEGITIGERIRNSKKVIERVADILAKWRANLFGIGDTEEASMRAVSQEQQNVIANKGAEVLATIPEDYSVTSAMAEEAVRTKADGIVLNAEGEVVPVNDSSGNYIRGLRVFGKSTQVTTTGKNLFSASLEVGLWLFSTKNKTTDEKYVKSTDLVAVSPGETYMFSGTAIKSFQGNLAFYDANGVYLGDDNQIYGFDSFTVPSGAYYIAFHIGTTFLSDINGTVQLEKGTVATTWEPYSGGYASPSPNCKQDIVSIENPIVDFHNKNLWNHEYDTVDLTSCLGWGSSIWNNDAVVRTLKPNTAYTMSFEVTALSIPEYETMFADNCGFTLFSSKASGAYIIMAQSIGDGVLKVGEKRTVKSTFTTPANLLDDGMGYGILRYTQRFIKSDGTADYATVKFENIQLEFGDTATEYTDANMQTLTIPHTLPGIPVTSGGNYTDANGQQWICDEVDFERGVYVKRIMLEALVKASGFNDQGLYCPLYNGKAKYDVRVLCTHVSSKKAAFANGKTGEYASCVLYKEALPASVVDVPTGQTWLDELQRSGTPCTVAYILATPIETPLQADELATFRVLRTNYPNTTVLNDAGAHMQLKYLADTKSYIDNQITKRIAELTNT